MLKKTNEIPKMAVVMPVYNGDKYLRKSIDSLLKQSLEDFELLINDDCSSDNTRDIIKSYSDSRIRFYQSEVNLGIFGSINKLIKFCSAPYIHLWAQDDIMEESCLEVCHSFHHANGDVAFSFSSNYRIDENDKIVRRGQDNGNWVVLEPKDSIPLFLIYGCIPGNISSVTLNKEYVFKEGLFNENLAFIGDFDMWVRLSANYKFGKIDKRLVRIRDHVGQASRRDDMYLKKLKETKPLYDLQISLLDADIREKGSRVVKYLHQPHFALVALNFLKRGRLKCFFDYLKELSRYDYLILVYLRTMVLVLAMVVGKKVMYRRMFFKAFRKHIKNFN